LPGEKNVWIAGIKIGSPLLNKEIQLATLKKIWSVLPQALSFFPDLSRQEWQAQNFPAEIGLSGREKAQDLVAEMLAERWCRRHSQIHSVLFQGSGENFFVFVEAQSEVDSILRDLSSLAISFESFGRCLLLPHSFYPYLSVLNLADQPFRFFDWHKEFSLYQQPPLRHRRLRMQTFPQELKKLSLSYLLYVFRQPPQPFSFWSQQIVNVLLRYRIGDGGENAGSEKIWDQYAKFYPSRSQQLQLAFSCETQVEIWAKTYPWLLMEMKTLLDAYPGYAQKQFRP
jgi:hypothetical protein